MTRVSGRFIERQGITYEMNSQVPFTGISKAYYENGQLTAWAEESVKAIPADRLEKRQGIMYEMNSQVSFTGVSEVYYGNDKVKKRANYKEGEKHGMFDTYYKNGTLKIRVIYKEGEQVGPSKRYDKNGRRLK